MLRCTGPANRISPRSRTSMYVCVFVDTRPRLVFYRIYTLMSQPRCRGAGLTMNALSPLQPRQPPFLTSHHNVVYSSHFVCATDIHAKVCGHADASPRLRPSWQYRWQFAQWQWPGGQQAAPMSTVPQVIQLQPPVGPAHTRAHRRKAVQVFLLRASIQTAQPRATAH